MIHCQKKARLEDRGKAKLAIKTAFRKGKRGGKPAKKTVSWKNQFQCLEKDVDETWQDDPRPLEADSNEPMRGRNEEVVSSTFAVIYIQVMLITYAAISR